MINLKYVLIDKIEKELKITLTNEQLAFIFNEDDKLIVTAPRQYGKDLMMSIKIAVNSLLNPNHKIAVVNPSRQSNEMSQNQVRDILNLIAPNAITRCVKNPFNEISVCDNTVIKFFNGSTSSFTNGELRGHKFDETYIMEMSSYKEGLEYMVDLMLMSMIHKKEYMLNLIGTPDYTNQHVRNFINSQYYKHMNFMPKHSPGIRCVDEEGNTFQANELGELFLV